MHVFHKVMELIKKLFLDIARLFRYKETIVEKFEH